MLLDGVLLSHCMIISTMWSVLWMNFFPFTWMWWGRSQAIFDPKKFPIQPSHLNTFGNIYSIYSQSLQEVCEVFEYKLFLNVKVLMQRSGLVMLSRVYTKIKEDVFTEMLILGLWKMFWCFYFEGTSWKHKGVHYQLQST